MTTFGGVTATVVKMGDTGTDARNNPTLGPTGATFDLTGCRLDQIKADEVLTGRDTIVTTWLLITPPPAASLEVTYLDRITIGADTYEQVGHPDTLANFNGSPHHLELILRRADL